MKFPRYAEYKESGVEWLGEVPGHWGVVPVRAVATYNDDVLGETTHEDYEIEYVEISDVDVNRGVTGTTAIIFGKSPSRARRRVRHGDVIVSTVRTYLRAIAPIANPAENWIVSTGFAVIRPRSVQSGFMSYLFRAEFQIAAIIARSVGVSYPAINASELMYLKTPIPPQDEQSVIAVFLDRETLKIDALVAEQEKLIALLKEKRQAVISHAVTKGLDPNAPMKDSGVEWLGEVPGHWDVIPLKRDLAFLTSGSRGWAEHYSDNGSIFIRIGNLTRDSIKLDLSDVQYVDVPDGVEGERTKVQSGDVLFSITAYLGSVAVAPEGMESAYVSQHVALARLHQKRFVPTWVGYVALSYVGKTYLETQGYGGTKVQLSLNDVASLVVTVPPVSEQSAIVAYLDQATDKLDTLTTEAHRAIDLLKERRSALISAAVTGKIDVRGFVTGEKT